MSEKGLGRKGEVWLGMGGEEKKKEKKEKRFKTQYKDICMLKFIMCNYNKYNIIQPGI